jgi:hypothetical protein
MIVKTMMIRKTKNNWSSMNKDNDDENGSTKESDKEEEEDKNIIY